MLAEAEIHYTLHMQYKGFCTSADTYTLIARHKSSPNEIICFDSTDAFAVATKLSNGKYYCIDTTTSHVETTTPPTTTVCPNEL